jgi:hypothetical protein
MPARRAAAPDAAGQGKLRRPTVPPTLFGITLGLAGLGQAWQATEPVVDGSLPAKLGAGLVLSPLEP